MTPETFLHAIVRPGLWELGEHGGPAPSLAAERFLIAIALQEADARHRYQGSPHDLGGPARGFWQFEPAGVLGVLTHRSTSVLAEQAALRAHVVAHTHAITRAIEGHDRLAVAFARLLIWTHPDPLPTDREQAWAQYLNLWRPGRPRHDRWAACWRAAHDATLPQEVADADTQAGAL